MSVRFCGKCGAGWGPDFNFCAKDGTPLNAAPVAQLGVDTPVVAAPAVEPEPKLQRKPRGAWSFSDKDEAAPAPAKKAPSTRTERAVAASPKAAPARPARAPAEVPVKVPAAQPPVVEAPRHAAAFDVPDLDFGDRAPARAASPAPRIEGPATRGRARPQKEHAVVPDVARAMREIAPEPIEAETVDGLRGEANVESIFTAKKRRDAAAFSETAWFKRPLESAEIDPLSGRVSHTESTYRPDPKVTPTQRRKFSLRRVGEAV